MRGRRTRRIAALRLAVIALAAAGCAGGRDARSAGRGAAAVELRPATGAEIMSLVGAPGARAVLVNVWATWCEPCREEFPAIVKAARAHRREGLRVILVSGDFTGRENAAREFLAAQGVDFITWIKTGPDMEFVNALDPAWSGTLPATWVYDGTGARRAFWSGKTTYDSLETKIREALAPPAGRTSK